MVGAGRESGRCEDVQVRGRRVSRWEGSGEECSFHWKYHSYFPSTQVPLSCSFLLLPTPLPLLHHILSIICFLFVIHFVALSAKRMLHELILTPFLLFLSQVRLQGDAVQLNFLPGSPRTTPRFLSFLRGSAGEPKLHLLSIYPKLHCIGCMYLFVF